MQNPGIIVNNVPDETIVFKKILSKADKENQLSVPSRILPRFPVGPDHKRDFTAYDQHGKEWPFVLATRQEGHSKPILNQDEWQKFVKAYNLGANEYAAVVFYIPHDDPHMQVRALRRVMVFPKTPVWTAI